MERVTKTFSELLRDDQPISITIRTISEELRLALAHHQNRNKPATAESMESIKRKVRALGGYVDEAFDRLRSSTE